MPIKDSRRRSADINLKSLAKPGENDWITSGPRGSRDAVLVFRTSILNQLPNKSSTSEESSANKESTSEISKNSITHNQLDSSDRILFNVNSPNSQLPSTSKCVYKKKYYHEASNTLVENIKHNSCKSSRKPNKKKYTSITLTKHLNYSMSSSETSISSECDDAADLVDYPKLSNKDSSSIGNGTVNKLAETHEHNNDDEEENEPEKLDDNFEMCVFSDDMPALNLNMTYKFMQTETKLLRRIFVRHGLTEVSDDKNFSILWTGVHMRPDILRNLAPYQRVNHFPRSYELTRKDRLYKNIERLQHLRGFKHFDIVPQSFILPLEIRDLISAHNKHRGPWIVKPAASSRGRGIFIVNTPDQIPQDEQVLVSKYIADPLCIDGHKCDLRVYALVTSFDPLIIYIYEEGLVRIATVKYDRNADNLWNPCMHLCNYSINKYHSDYIKSSDAHVEDVGHKWTLSALLRHLKLQNCDTNQLMTNIEDLIIKSILACAQSIISACRMFVPSGNNCFELYGFDILIDDTLKPWLLEVNLSPSLGVDSPLDAKVKASLLADLLTCVGIPAYSSAMRAHYDSKWTRFRNINYSRRTTSVDSVTNNSSNSGVKRSGSNNNLVPSLPLTLEEQRIVRGARLQHARRGGFVRIFPTEDTMQRYGTYLDSATGIPLSTPVVQGQTFYSMIVPHNYNTMLFNHLYGKEGLAHGIKEDNSQSDRMNQYERALEATLPITFNNKRIEPKCEEEGKRLRRKILKLIDNGCELTQLQARQTFALYLETVLRRLAQEPRDYHEKLILKFLNRVGGTVKTPVPFRNSENLRIISKARTAMIAKLLGDFLDQYNRDTEAYVDSFDYFGMIPISLFSEFLSQSQESDLEAVLALHTNLTGTMPYLYNRCGISVPTTPPIPSGVHGFLKALPIMVLSGSGARDFNKCDGYYKLERENSSLSNEKLPEITNAKKSHQKR